MFIKAIVEHIPSWEVFVEAGVTLIVPLIILYIFKWLNKLEEV